MFEQLLIEKKLNKHIRIKGENIMIGQIGNVTAEQTRPSGPATPPEYAGKTEINVELTKDQQKEIAKARKLRADYQYQISIKEEELQKLEKLVQKIEYTTNDVRQVTEAMCPIAKGILNTSVAISMGGILAGSLSLLGAPEVAIPCFIVTGASMAVMGGARLYLDKQGAKLTDADVQKYYRAEADKVKEELNQLKADLKAVNLKLLQA